MLKGFVSDNWAGVHPEIMKAIAACNEGHQTAYGGDDFCARAKVSFAKLFERPVAVEFAFNGTGANLLALACCVRPFEAVVCADCAHINTDETGAPERILGAKLLGVPTADGKLTPADVAPLLSAIGSQHHSQPRVVSITNITEWGAVYTPGEIRALCDFAHANGLLVHMDGARIANAVVAAGCTMAEMTWKAGVDALSFGGVKNGLMFGEAVVFLNEALAENAPYVRKNIAQLQSKMRFIGAQYEALIETGLWETNARRANEMARKIEAAVRALPGAEIVHPAHANVLFAKLDAQTAEWVQRKNLGAELNGIVRMVAAWDTLDADVEGLRAP